MAVCSAALAAGVAGAYTWRPTALAAVTIWPLACWVILGLVPLPLLWPRAQRRVGLGLAVVLWRRPLGGSDHRAVFATLRR
ncbi:MAG: hypothetical protein IT204_05320 [Fimbriimonadaceae bacterium]|nr:hypothetical protein [Fimbriimonadaceae bacterium]